MPTFQTIFVPPSLPSGLELDADLDLSRVRLTWDASAIAQIDFAGFRIYRSLDNGLTFSLLTVLTLVTDVSYDDFEAPLNLPILYKLTQSNIDFESGPIDGSASLDSLMWWVVVPNDTTLTFPIAKVRGAQMTSPKTQDIFSPIGRATRIAVGDVVHSETGTLTFLAMPDNPGMIGLLKSIQARMDGGIILKAPDGVTHTVQYGDMTRSFTSIGGLQEVTIPFTGVS
ncbi:MAG: hypothetical protein H0U13_04605 [Gemmatimonadaceae bacterium]|nr:hypothetical protein [Gemmatimonadaceae bacterium]